MPSLPPLPHENLLVALGEVSAAFVGFSLVVGVLSARSADSVGEAGRISSIRDVAELGLLAIAASFLPLAIHTYDVATASIWRTASTALLLLWGMGFGASVWRQRASIPEAARARPIRIVLICACNVAGAGLLITNLIVGGAASGGRYVTAVLLLLVLAGLQFVSATFDDSAERTVFRR